MKRINRIRQLLETARVAGDRGSLQQGFRSSAPVGEGTVRRRRLRQLSQDRSWRLEPSRDTGGRQKTRLDRGEFVVSLCCKTETAKRKSLSLKMERAKGFEPSPQNSQAVHSQDTGKRAVEGYTQIRAHIFEPDCPQLRKVVHHWSALSAPLKAAILAIVASATEDER